MASTVRCGQILLLFTVLIMRNFNRCQNDLSIVRFMEHTQVFQYVNFYYCNKFDYDSDRVI